MATDTDRILRTSQVLEIVGGISRMTLNRWRKSGRFPEPDVQLGVQMLGWRESTVNAWIQSQGRPNRA